MFLKSIQWRLVIIIAAITFVLIAVVWVFLNTQVEEIFYRSFSQDINESYSALHVNKNTTLKQLELALKSKAINPMIEYANKRSYTILENRTGEIIYSSDPFYTTEKAEEFRAMLYQSKNLQSVLSGNTKVGNKSFINQDNSDGFYDYVLLQNLKEGSYILYFKYSRSEVTETIGQFNKMIAVSMILAVVAAVITGYFLAKTITVPIVNIMHKAEKITAGEFGQVLEIKSEDEIGMLARTFNYMSKRLKNMLIEISSEKNKVETILNYMTDGIIAYNLVGEILHINPAAKRILENADFQMSFKEFVEEYELGIDIKDILKTKDKNNFIKNIETADKYIRVQFASFTDEENNVEGIIVVLQDVTEQQKLEMMRKEFVANVSHELRTPLTSIKSYSETLLDGALEDHETAIRFVEVINSEADRMSRLVKDLLTLSRHDVGIKINKVELDPVKLACNCVDKMQISAKEKNQTLETYVIGKPPLIEGDKDKLVQLLINIINNAIKYTPEGGKISIYVGTLYDQVYFKVVDTGIGIPQEDIDRVFERFYRVDKARSRQMGGTGLGLSIAKEIVEVHGGTITAQSQVDKGTEITVKLPMKKGKKGG